MPFSDRKIIRIKSSNTKKRKSTSSEAERWEEWIFSKDKSLDPPVSVETPDTIREALKNTVEKPEDNKPVIVRHPTFNLIPTEDMTVYYIYLINYLFIYLYRQKR